MAVIGDVMLDEYLIGDAERVSPEAPIIVVDVRRQQAAPGGAANVACGVRALGGRSLLFGVCGRDEPGQRLLRLLDERGVDAGGVLAAQGAATTVKTRIVARGQQVLRIDRERVRPLAGGSLDELLRRFAGRIGEIEAVVVSDYAKGVVGRALIEGALKASGGRFPVIADPKGRTYTVYQGVDVITPNAQEAAAATGLDCRDDESVVRAGRRLARFVRRGVLITRGEAGMTYVPAGGAEPFHLPTLASRVNDVSGAGDACAAMLALTMAAGLPIVQSLALASANAAACVAKPGTSTASLEEVAAVLEAQQARGA